MILFTVIFKVTVGVVRLIMCKYMYFIREETIFETMYVEAMWLFPEPYWRNEMKLHEHVRNYPTLSSVMNIRRKFSRNYSSPPHDPESSKSEKRIVE
jgi:hypothetical protein